MDRYIRKTLENNLPAQALDYLNESFRKLHEAEEQLKKYKEKTDWLSQELSRKDQMLWSMYERNSGSQGGQGGQQMGYQQSEPQRGQSNQNTDSHPSYGFKSDPSMYRYIPPHMHYPSHYPYPYSPFNPFYQQPVEDRQDAAQRDRSGSRQTRGQGGGSGGGSSGGGSGGGSSGGGGASAAVPLYPETVDQPNNPPA